MLNTTTHQKLEEDVEHAVNAGENHAKHEERNAKLKGKKDVENVALADIDEDKFRIIMI